MAEANGVPIEFILAPNQAQQALTTVEQETEIEQSGEDDENNPDL